MMKPALKNRPYTCEDYREEMLLLGLKRRLMEEHLTESEKNSLSAEILRLEKEMGLE